MTAPETEPTITPQKRRPWWLALGFALTFPALIAWVEFLAPAPEGAGLNLATQTAYYAGKVVQFTFPLVCLWFLERRLPRPAAPRLAGLAWGLGFGLVVGLGLLVLYFAFLRDTALFARSAGNIHGKLAEFGLDSPAGFAGFAFFIAVLHSFLEEYYWRWFVFGQLRRLVSSPWAIALSSLGFMVPHVFALATFLGAEFVLAVAVFTLCVGVGGAAWAWLYQRSASLYAAWLSHLLVDAALFGVGYDLFF
jgi:membrane protease YdiL (CAAX protease family)